MEGGDIVRVDALCGRLEVGMCIEQGHRGVVLQRIHLGLTGDGHGLLDLVHVLRQTDGSVGVPAARGELELGILEAVDVLHHGFALLIVDVLALLQPGLDGGAVVIREAEHNLRRFDLLHLGVDLLADGELLLGVGALHQHNLVAALLVFGSGERDPFAALLVHLVALLHIAGLHLASEAHVLLPLILCFTHHPSGVTDELPELSVVDAFKVVAKRLDGIE